LPEPQEILGFPDVTLTLKADQPTALLAVRLCDVAPTGESLLVTWGLLNLTHRESHTEPTPLIPGQPYTVTVRLNAIAHQLPAGHRWRVAVSPTYWPHAWPSPQPVTLTLLTGADSFLTLPVRPPQPQDTALAPFDLPEGTPRLAIETFRTASQTRALKQDLVSGHFELTQHNDDGHLRFADSGLEHDAIHTTTYTIVEGDPLSASVRCTWKISIGCAAWRTTIKTNSHMTADATNFYVSNVLDAYEGQTRIFTKTWYFKVARDLV
jgi:hypothetical protein